MPSDRYEVIINIRGQDQTGSSLSNVNRELSQLNKSAGSVKGNVTDANTSLASMKNVAIGLAGAWGTLQLGQRALEMAELGSQVTNVESVFRNLTGGSKEAEATLKLLRDSTGGVVDNMALMQNANQLLITGLASTNEQAAELTQLGVRLGVALGQGPVESLENLNAALLNNSYPRLDTLGISAARVRERVAELKKEGLDMSEAFATAVLEQGRLAIEKLGDAASVSETSFGRLKAQAQNFTQQLSKVAFQAGETISQLVILGDIALGGTGFGAIEAPTPTRRELITEGVFRNLDELEFISDLNQLQGIEFKLVPLIDIAEEDREFFDRLRGNVPFLVDAIVNDGNEIISKEDVDRLEEIFQIDFQSWLVDTQGEALNAALAIDILGSAIDDVEFQDRFNEASASVEAWTDTIKSGIGQVDRLKSSIIAATLEAGADTSLIGPIVEQNELRRLQDAYNDTIEFDRKQADLDRQQLERARQDAQTQEDFDFKRLQAEYDNAVEFDRKQADLDRQQLQRAEQDAASFEALRLRKRQPLGQFNQNVGLFRLDAQQGEFDIGGQTFFDPSELAQTQRFAEQLQNQVGLLREQAEADDFRFISEEDVANAQAIADEAATIASEAQRGAEAFENLSLAGLLGETSGGREGELLDLVLADLQARIDPEDEAAQAGLEDIQSQFNLATGRETELSQFVEDSLSDQIATLAERFGADVAASAAEGALGVIEQGRIAGTSEDLIQAQATASVFGTGLGARAEGFQESEVGQLAQNLFGLVAGGEQAAPEDDSFASDEEMEKFGIVEGGLTAISQLTFDDILDPLFDDIDVSLSSAEGLIGALSDVANGIWSAEIPLSITLNDLTGIELGSNPTFWDAIKFAFESNGHGDAVS